MRKRKNAICTAKGGRSHRLTKDAIVFSGVRNPTGEIVAQFMILLRNAAAFQKNTYALIVVGQVTEKAKTEGEVVTSVKRDTIPACASENQGMNNRVVTLS